MTLTQRAKQLPDENTVFMWALIYDLCVLLDELAGEPLVGEPEDKELKPEPLK